MRLSDKVAIITGAGSGFGEGIAERFAREGARVVVNDIDPAGGERVAAAIRAAGGQAIFVRADVGRGEDVAAMLAATLAAFGRLDIVVNNAGVSHRNQSLLTVEEAEFDRVWRVNVKSLYWTARHIAPHFQAQGGGVFVNIASTAGVRPRPGSPRRHPWAGPWYRWYRAKPPDRRGPRAPQAASAHGAVASTRTRRAPAHLPERAARVAATASLSRPTASQPDPGIPDRKRR